MTPNLDGNDPNPAPSNVTATCLLPDFHGASSISIHPEPVVIAPLSVGKTSSGAQPARRADSRLSGSFSLLRSSKSKVSP